MNRILNFRKLADNQTNNEGQEIINIYRSADVSFANIGDIEKLIDLNISNVIDLRSNQEVSQHPQLEDMRIKIKHINVIGNGKQNLVEDFDPKQLLEFMIDLYRNDFVTIEGFKNEFNYILSLNGAPFLFHCTAGKDRTGITGVILMHILGFTKQQIIDEYLIIDQTLVDSIYERFTENLAS